MLLDAMGIGVYVLTTFILFVLIYQEGKPSYDIVSVYLIVSYYIMASRLWGQGHIFPQSRFTALISHGGPEMRLFYTIGFFASY